MREINLLQPEKQKKFSNLPTVVENGRIVLALTILLVAELAVFGGFLFLNFRLSKEIADTSAGIAEIDAKLTNPDPQLAEAIKAQAALRAVGALLDGHRHWTNVWKELSRVTYKNSQYISLNATLETNKFSVNGRSPSYTDLGKLILGLQTSPEFTDIKLLESGPISERETGIKFSISVSYKPAFITKFSAGSSSSTAKIIGGN